MEDEKMEAILSRVYSVIGYRNTEELDAEARQIQALLDTLEQKSQDFLDRPDRITGLLPQCLGGKIKARLSSFCAVHALKDLAKNPPSLGSAEEWTGAATKCAELELINYFTTKARQSNAASNRISNDHEDIYVFMEDLLEKGVSIADAYKRAEIRFGLQRRQLQNIRKKFRCS